MLSIIDEVPLFDEKFIELCQWVSEYYHYSLGEILSNALPTTLRRDAPADKPGAMAWRLTSAGTTELDLPKRSKKHLELVDLLRTTPEGLPEKQLLDLGYTQQMIYYLARYDYLEPFTLYADKEIALIKALELPELNSDQASAVAAITQNLDNYQAYLLDGVTGSGKTEIYLRVIAEILKKGQQALILVPEISLTPQTVERFTERFNVNIISLHSGLSHRQRSEAWLAAKHGTAQIIIGTRSAIFTPLANLGVIIVDEEHDISFKQQDSLRYSARDVAVKRSHLENVPIILGSATPSFESLYNAQNERYKTLSLPLRAGAANPPTFKLIDIRKQKIEEGISQPLLLEMKKHLENGNQVLLFLNRRGFSPMLTCHDCGWIASCDHCDASYTLHWKNQVLRCHHCDTERSVFSFCQECNGGNLLFLGQGTERIELALNKHFTDYPVVRIDRDNTRRKGSLDALLNQVHQNKPCILVGTQMLAKGHHFDNVTMVGILDADSGLFSIDFRTTERIAQLLMQVAGRAGRGKKPGEVLIQTRHPEHPLLLQLITHGYHDFAKLALADRQSVGLPPYGYIALLRAEAINQNQPLQFLKYIAELTQKYGVKEVYTLGPVPAPMERRAGRYRMQLLFQTTQRKALQQLLRRLTTDLGISKISRGVRWSLDVDPQDMF